jgi:hypothetical protein
VTMYSFRTFSSIFSNFVDNTLLFFKTEYYIFYYKIDKKKKLPAKINSLKIFEEDDVKCDLSQHCLYFCICLFCFRFIPRVNVEFW